MITRNKKNLNEVTKEYTFVDYLAEKAKREEKYFKNYKFYTKKIKKSAQKFLGKESRVLVFGSILKKSEIPRDIDVLIISAKIKPDTKRGEIVAKILKEIGFLSPFEIHLTSPEDYESWYKNFIKKEYLEIK